MFCRDQSPSAPLLYVGTPLSADTPAPVNTTTNRALHNRATARSMFSSIVDFIWLNSFSFGEWRWRHARQYTNGIILFRVCMNARYGSPIESSSAFSSTEMRYAYEPIDPRA